MNGGGKERVVALTFDADLTQGMLKSIRAGRLRSPQYDLRILDILQTTRTPATFFLTGLWAETYPDIVKQIAGEPLFEIENHSFDHAAWSYPCFGLRVLRDAAARRAEIDRAADSIERITGRRTRYYRFPGGCHRKGDLAIVAAAGHRAVQWDVVSADVTLREPSSVAREVTGNVKPGSIIVMHLNGAPNTPATADALRRIIPELTAKGYRFATLEALLSAPAPPHEPAPTAAP